MIPIVQRPRNKQGKFQEFSELSDKTIGLRIFKKDEKKFYELAEKLNISATECARKIVHEWLKDK